MKTAQIVLLSMLAACGYGVVHDEITVRLCIEYFTVAHPPLFYTGSPTLLALCWGIAATVGLGAALGVILALVSQSAGAKPYPLSRLGRSILFLLAIMGASAFVAGCIGYVLSRYGLVSPPAELSVVIAESERDRFMAAWFAHGVSYVFGLGGGALLCFLHLAVARQTRRYFFSTTHPHGHYPRCVPRNSCGVRRMVPILCSMTTPRQTPNQAIQQTAGRQC